MIRDALSVLPTRPVLYIAPLIVVVVLAIFYWDRYSACSRIQQFRSSLNDALHAQGMSSRFRLAEFTNFGWDQVRIVENFVPGFDDDTCPLDWNWPPDERDKLIAAGRLTVLIFGQEGAIVAYQEIRSDEVAFHGVDSSLSPQQAVFRVAANSASSSAISLILD